MPKHCLSTDKIVDQDVAVNCRRCALDLVNKRDSFLSKNVDPALTTYIATLQSILKKACGMLETRAKLQKRVGLGSQSCNQGRPLHRYHSYLCQRSFYSFRLHCKSFFVFVQIQRAGRRCGWRPGWSKFQDDCNDWLNKRTRVRTSMRSRTIQCH